MRRSNMLQFEINDAKYKQTLSYNGVKKRLSEGYTKFNIVRYETSDGYYTGPAILNLASYKILQKYAKTKLGILLNRALKTNFNELGSVSLLKKEGSEEYYIGVVGINELKKQVPKYELPPQGLFTPWSTVFSDDYVKVLNLFTTDEFNAMSSIEEMAGCDDSSLLNIFNSIANRIVVSDNLYAPIPYMGKWIVFNDMIPAGFRLENKGSVYANGYLINTIKEHNIFKTIPDSFKSELFNMIEEMLANGNTMDRAQFKKKIDDRLEFMSNASSNAENKYETQLAGYGLNSVDVLDFATASPVDLKEAFNDFYNDYMLNGTEMIADSSDFVDGYVWCGTCRKYHKSSELVKLENSDIWLCPLALQEMTFICSRCKRPFVDTEDWNYTDVGERYCRECSCGCEEKEFMGIRYYHDSPSIRYYDYDKEKKENFIDINANNGKFKGYGIELEIGGKGETATESEKVIKLLKNEAYCMHDGSICSSNTRSDGGFEIITYPHTEDALYNMKWQNTMNYLLKRGYKSHDIKTCGLHMHFSRTLFNNSQSIINMMYFYDRFYDDVCNFARRSKAKAERWAGKWTSGQIDDLNAMFYRLADNYDRYNRCGSHGMRYKAVNIINDNTIEVRIMRGTLNYDTFLATLDFLITIQKNANNISIDDLDNLDKWFEGMKPETLAYIREHRCFSPVHKRIPALTEIPDRVKDEVDWSYTEAGNDGFIYSIKMIDGVLKRCIKNTKTGEMKIEEIKGVIL